MIISSADPLEGPLFEGYVWMGTDLVVGELGAQEFFEERSTSIPHGEDGCYVSAYPTHGGWTVGTDYRGLSKLFLYRSDGVWAIGSSWYKLVKYVRSAGWPLTLTEDTVAAYLNKGKAELSAFDAHFHQIRLIPSIAHLEIRDFKPEIRYRKILEVKEYSNALSEFVNLWRSRLYTILQANDGFIQFDLSGGIDSRTVIAFALSKGSSLARAERTRVVSSRAPWAADDLRVAEEIAGYYGFEINRAQAKTAAIHNEYEAIRGWKEDCLGVYNPVYLYGTKPAPNVVHAHGAGGGNFRPTYRSIDGVARRAQPHLSKNSFEQWRAKLVDSVDLLLGHQPGISPELLHYREFRNRFHFGHRPHRSLVFMPLESKLTDSLTDRNDQRNSRQLYFDVMESLCPGLMYMKFDLPDKSPTEENIASLTKVSLTEPRVGAVFWDSRDTLEPQGTRADAFTRWVEGAETLLSTKLVADFMPLETMEAAKGTIAAWRGSATRPKSDSPGMQGLANAYAIDFLMNGGSEV